MAKSKYDNYTKEQLIDKIKLLEKQRYGLVWEDKPEAIADQCERELPVLTEDKTKEIINDTSKATNFIFEGDNYHTLYTLNFTHKRKIDVIYIDPPYNTGNSDFKYNDFWVEKEDNYRHSKWLSFMHKRLRLAKFLLKDSGVIFISIDDNEIAQTKLLCNSIFGENNFVAQCVLVNNIAGRSDKKHIALAHEYVLIYQRSDQFSSTGLPLSENLLLEYKFEDKIGKYRLQGLRKRGANSRREDRPNLFYPIYFNEKDSKISVIKSKNYLEIVPKLSNGFEGNWRWSKETFSKNIDKILIKQSNKKFEVFEKVYLQDEIGETKTTKLKSYLLDSDYTTDNATTHLKQIIPSSNFNNPKSVFFIMDLIRISTPRKNGIILDFFAGSGTTGQAVLELNELDNGSRQFILCTNNENKICEEVTYPRIKKVIEGYGAKKGIKANVKYFTTDYVPFVITDNDKRTLVARSTELLCIAENTFEVVKQNKKKLDFSIFKNAKQHTAIIYDEDSIENCCSELNKINPKHKVIIYVFSYDHTYDEVDFETLHIKFDVKPIPEAILNVYRKISKLKRK